jgi:hypothetical protein
MVGETAHPIGPRGTKIPAPPQELPRLRAPLPIDAEAVGFRSLTSEFGFRTSPGWVGVRQIVKRVRHPVAVGMGFGRAVLNLQPSTSSQPTPKARQLFISLASKTAFSSSV